MEKIITQLPTSWKEFTLEQFQKLQAVIVTEKGEFEGITVGVDNTLKMLSALTDLSVDQLEELPMQTLVSMAKKLGFMAKPPCNRKEESYHVEKLR